MRLKRVTPPRPFRLTQEGFTGMRDSPDPSTGSARKALLLRNVYPDTGPEGSAVVARPGYQTLASLLGGTTTGWSQRTYQFTALDGGEYTLAFVAGKLYTVDWAARTLTLQAMGGVPTLDVYARIGCCTFADSVIFHDGIGQPIRATVAGGVWSFAVLSNCPVLYGEPVVYYAKLFGIKAAERNVIVWSEEADPTLGYEAGGYNNAWQLAQTDQEGLYALAATNANLFYFRARSIGTISGAVTSELTGTGVEDSISTSVGTVSPWSIVKHESSIFFLDADRRPQRLLIGGGLQDPPLWEDAKMTALSLSRVSLVDAIGCDWTPGNLVLFAVSLTDGAPPTQIMAFDADTGAYAGVWRTKTPAGSFRSLDVVKDRYGAPVLIHGNEGSALYDWGAPDGDVWDDAGTAVEHLVHGSALGYDHLTERHFDRVDLSLRFESDLTDLKVAYTLPRGQALEQGASAAGGSSLWDDASWDSAVWAGDATETHKSIGLSADGRWIQVRLRHTGLGEKMGVLGWSVTGYYIGAIPSAR